METPIYDFVTAYIARGTARLHMPGHKGRTRLGCEARDLTEIAGADELYEPEGVIAQSERSAAALFGAQRTFFVTEGSSQCVRAMLHLARGNAPRGTRPVIVAARNAHKSFLHGAALADVDIVWLRPEEEPFSLCRCPVTAAQLTRTLDALPAPPAAVYVTSPDYLGGTLDLRALADAAHARGVPLLVDNAHGAYLHFLPTPAHPLDLGADLCCDSAHKTLPALTGAAYLHVGKNAPPAFADDALRALALHGSSSPSYLILQSLDLCGRYLADGYSARLAAFCTRVEGLRATLREQGWLVADSDPLRVTLDAAGSGLDGAALADRLRDGGVECEYADPDYVVLMCTPDNGEDDLRRVAAALGRNPRAGSPLPRRTPPRAPAPETVCSVRDALFAPCERLTPEEAVGRVLAQPAAACPPEVPVAVSGERLTAEHAAQMRYYGIGHVEVVCAPEPRPLTVPK